MKSKTQKTKAGVTVPAAPRVLCGTDFSKSASAAAGAAAALAQRWNAPLDLVHVAALPADPRPRQKMKEEAARLKELGAEVRTAVLDGLPDEALVERADPTTCRLVVMASLGKRATERWVLGSVSERTAERARVPTLVVRDAATISAWARGERRLKVFVAFDFTRTADGALSWVKELQAIGACDLVVGFVDWLPEQRARLGGAGPVPLVANPAEVQAVLERDVRVRAEELLGTGEFRVRVEANWGRADVRLAEMAREEGSDLIVVGSHQYWGFERLWHGSVSRGVLHHAAMNVAIVPLAVARASVPETVRPVRRVIVSTDFSDWANHAIAHGCALVPRGGTLHLVHVADPRALPGGVFAEQQDAADAADAASAHRANLVACEDKLRALIPPEARSRGILAEVEVVEHRDAATGIMQAAERLGADVICIGSHGRTGRLKTLLGSVTQRVLALSGRPLLVVRPPRE